MQAPIDRRTLVLGLSGLALAGPEAAAEGSLVPTPGRTEGPCTR